MANPTLTKTFTATGEIAARALITFGSADGQAVVASAATDTLLGVAEQIGSRENMRVDVIINGIAEVVAGGNVTRGDALTSNAAGKVITSSTATDRIIGFAMQSGVASDIIEVMIAQG